MKALILAAGYATRLYPLTKDRPKSLLVVGKTTIADHLIRKLEELDDVDQICIVANQKFYSVFCDWLKTVKSKKRITLDDDGSTSNDNRLGAIADIKLVLESQRIYDNLLILAGDNIFDWNLKDFIEYAKSEPGSITAGAYDIKDVNKAVNYGVVEIDEKGCLKDFLEKPEQPPSSLIATGIYYFPDERLNLISRYINLGKGRDAPGHLIQWIHKDYKIRCYVFKGIWYDVGDMESYRKANLAFANQ